MIADYIHVMLNLRVGGALTPCLRDVTRDNLRLPIVQSFDPVLPRLLTASLNKVQFPGCPARIPFTIQTTRKLIRLPIRQQFA